jgi:hypothetical protein
MYVESLPLGHYGSEDVKGVLLTLCVDLIYESVEIIADKFRAFDKMEKALEGKGKELDKEIKKLK